MGYIVEHCRHIGLILDCIPPNDQRTLSAAYMSIRAAEDAKSFDRETHRHAAEILLQGFMQSTDGVAQPGTPKGIHLGGIRIFVREALRQILAAREQ